MSDGFPECQICVTIPNSMNPAYFLNVIEIMCKLVGWV